MDSSPNTEFKYQNENDNQNIIPQSSNTDYGTFNDHHHFQSSPVYSKTNYADKIIDFIIQSRYYIIIFWTIVFCFSIWLGLKFMPLTTLSFHAPEGTKAYDAKILLNKEFPHHAEQNSLIIYIRYPHKNINIINNSTQLFTIYLNHTLTSQYSHYVTNLDGYWIYEPFDYLLPVAMEYISSDNTSMVILVNCHKWAEYLTDFAITVQDIVDKYHHEHNLKYLVSLTGMPCMMNDVTESTVSDMLKIDLFCLPISLFILSITLSSVIFVIIPLIIASYSMFISFMCMYPIALYLYSVDSVAPAIMSTFCIAMSLDYSLFLLSRFREEISRETPVELSVRRMMIHAGKVIIVSGLTLFICVISLSFFPLDLISTIGIGAAISLFFCIVISLTISPSIILIFPNLFTTAAQSNIFFQKIEKKENFLEQQEKSYWFKSASFFTSFYPAIITIIVIFAILLPLSYPVLDMEHTVDDMQMLPTNAESLITYNEIEQLWSPGRLNSFYIICSRQEPLDGIFKNEFYVFAANLVQDLITKKLASPENVVSIVFTQSIPIDFFSATQALDSHSPFYNLTQSRLYRFIFQRQTNALRTSTLIEVLADFNPFGDQSQDWVYKTRDLLNQYLKQSESEPALKGLQLTIFGGGTEQVDAVDSIYSLFPIMISITISIIFVIIMVSFRSLFVPFRLILTISLPISMVYGSAVLFFQWQIFGCINPAMHDIHRLFWIVPIMSFAILVGLALDYDTFLYTRVYEYRLAGYDDRSSIMKAVYRTGGIITSAGLIMAVAFGGLFISDIKVLNEFSFFLCLGVLIDTFIVPSILFFVGRWNWWPTTVPEGTKDYTHDDNAIYFDGEEDFHSPHQPLLSDPSFTPHHI